MALEDDIRTLSGARLFSGLSREQLRLLAFGSESVQLAAGRDLYHEGGEADCAFVVAAGEITTFRERKGRRLMTDSAGPGAILGEMALIAKTQRLTSAVAETDTDLIRINRTLFRRILEEYPETAVMLQQQISRDFVAMIERIEALGRHFDPF